MAIVKLGTTVTGLRGTIGGITFSQSKSGPYARLWSRGSTRRTTYTNMARSYMTKWAPVWAALSPTTRSYWDALAAAPPEVDHDRFGNVILLSGWQWFVRCNQRTALFGMPPITSPPTSGPQVTPITTAFTATGPISADTDVQISWGASEFHPADIAVIKISAYPTTGLRKDYAAPTLITMVAAYLTSGVDLGFATLARLGAIQAGWTLSSYLYRRTLDGVQSEPYVLSATVNP